jgi:hypothetical protein
MAEREKTEGMETPPVDEPGAAPDALAIAEEAAAREAAEETSKADAPRVVRPRARTSRSSTVPDDAAGKSASRPEADESSVTVIPPGPPSVDRFPSTDALSIRQGGVQTANAKTIDINQGGIGRAYAGDIAVSQGGIGFARGERVSVEMGGIGAALGGEVHLTQGAAGNILARDVRIEQAGVRLIVANQVHAERTTGVLFLIARRVEGDVRTVLDWRGALAFGAAFGAVVALFRGRRR